jgi:hypothetical protein
MLAAVSFKLCSFCPCPCRLEVREYINAKLLGLYNPYLDQRLFNTIVSYYDKEKFVIQEGDKE